MKLGILGTGMIVKDLLQTFHLFDIEKTYVLGTKQTEEETKGLVEQYHLDGYYLDYDELLASDIDTVYVALPNHLHYAFAKKALENHKNAIIEKPITANVSELKELMDIAKKNELIMLEAMNVHYLPTYQLLKEKLSLIGETKIVNFNYSQYSSRYDAFKQGTILPAFDYHKAGGALMDLNVYNIHGVVGLFGKPQSVAYLANMEKGIDTSGILTLDYGSFKAVCIGAKDCKAPLMLTIQGNQGVLCMYKPVSQAPHFEFIDNSDQRTTYGEMDQHRLYYEFIEFTRIIDQKDYQKANQMLEISYTVSDIMTQARKQAGIVFDND